MQFATDNPAPGKTETAEPAISAARAATTPFQFRILDVVLVTTLTAILLAAVVQFSAVLLWVFAVAALLCLIFVWKVKHWKINLVVVAWLLYALLLPSNSARSRPARRAICRNNLYQISMALLAYEANRGSLPPAYIADKNGKPMHSWRVLILPYLDRLDLYEAYRFDEPWDGPNNRKLAGEIMRIYSCPKDAEQKTDTSYVAVVGANTVWPGAKRGNLSAIPDGSSNVVLLVEIRNSGIHWMEPRDLDATQMPFIVNAQNGQGISSGHSGGASVSMADGSTIWLSADTPPQVLRSLIQIDDGTLPLPE